MLIFSKLVQQSFAFCKGLHSWKIPQIVKARCEKLWPCENNWFSGTKDKWCMKLCILMINKHEHICVGVYSNDRAHACWQLSGWQNETIEGIGGRQKTKWRKRWSSIACSPSARLRTVSWQPPSPPSSHTRPVYL